MKVSYMLKTCTKFVCVCVKSDSEEDERLNNRHQSNKRQHARAVPTRARHSASTKVAQNEHNGSQENDVNRNVESALTVVQESIPTSDDDSAVHSGKRRKGSRKSASKFK